MKPSISSTRGLLLSIAALLGACGAPPDGDSIDQSGSEIGTNSPSASKGVFKHPGVLVNAGQLAFVKGKIAAGAEPWKTAFHQTQSSRFGSLSYTPHPIATVQCGPYSTPDVGCSDEKND